MAQTITLIPDSGIQFWPVSFSTDHVKKIRKWFWEERNGEYEDGTPRYLLHLLTEDTETGVIRDPYTHNIPPEEEIYELGLKQVLEVLENQWVPLPFFAHDSSTTLAEPTLRRGPANWVRGKLIHGTDDHLTFILAFDTALESEDSVFYNAPTLEDSQRQDHFLFTAQPRTMNWFLNEGWVGDWLAQIHDEYTQKQAERKTTSYGVHRYCEHYALYQTLLSLLEETGTIPRVYLLDGGQGRVPQKPVDVDLVLDLGNSRSCGILIEEHPGQGVDFTNSYPLIIHSLAQPWLVYTEPFPSLIEFSRAFFGSDLLSRRSGRNRAFAWPSPVRVGFEAAYLAGTRIGNEGLTGLSSPKRYLWDTRESAQGWRFNNGPTPQGIIDPPVNGPFMAMMTPSGRLLNAEEMRQGQNFMSQPLFSRSALFVFMLLEILLQAQLQINAPQTREQRRDKTRIRRLRTIMLTMPPGMHVAEQKLLRERAQAAIDLCWQLQHKNPSDKPKLRTELDEASATQIVWLYNEIAERLGGNVDEMFCIHGRIRENATPDNEPGHSLRLACIDIGGGTTDLMISTYTLPTGEAIRPVQNFRESFKTAGDDVLAHVITHIIIPTIEEALKEAGVIDPPAILNRALGQDWGGQSEQDRHLRRLLVGTTLEPAGLNILQNYEQINDRQTDILSPFILGDIMVGDRENRDRAAYYINQQAQQAGAKDFDIRTLKIETTVHQVESSITHVLGPVLSDLCEVIWTYDCDALLISGRPSRLRRVIDIIMAAMPVPPHRLINMHHYRVGAYYAFRDARNRIDDPKTTAVVGAALCMQAEGRLQNFVMRTREIQMRSTARFLGRLDKNGQLRNQNVWLKNMDLDGPPSEEVHFIVPDFENMTRIGYRQLDIERWPAQPLYTLEFGNFPGFDKIALPLSVKITRRDIDPDREESGNDYSNREQFQIEEVIDQNHEQLHPRIVRLRLQTLMEADGYWRDTGRFNLA